MRETPDATWFAPEVARLLSEREAQVRAEYEDRPCPHVVTSGEGSSYCALAESSVKRLEAQVAELEGKLAAMREALRKYAWVGVSGGTLNTCTDCGRNGNG